MLLIFMMVSRCLKLLKQRVIMAGKFEIEVLEIFVKKMLTLHSRSCLLFRDYNERNVLSVIRRLLLSTRGTLGFNFSFKLSHLVRVVLHEYLEHRMLLGWCQSDILRQKGDCTIIVLKRFLQIA